MNPRLAKLIKRSLGSLGHYRSKLGGDRFPGVAVLCYHGVVDPGEPGEFEETKMPFDGLHVRANELEAQCRLIRESCHPISITHWLSSRNGGAPLPERPVLFTFDDGYRNLYQLALPILERFEIPAVLFVCSEPVIGRRFFWYDKVALLHGEERVRAMKALPYADWLRECEAMELSALDETHPASPLLPKQLEALSRHPLIELGGHTRSHAVLSRAPEDRQRAEILRNREEIEELTGTKVRAFAYPGGLPEVDYDPISVRIVSEVGFELAFTTQPAFADELGSPLQIPRFVMLAGIPAEELAHRLSYSWRR